MSYEACAFTIHKHNHYSLNIVGDSQSYIIHQQETHTEAERHQKHTTALIQEERRVACVLLTEYSMVPLGLWNDMRLPSFFSGVFFWPVSESKRGKVRITFMFLSPQLVTSCRFPAPWVDSSFVNSERASQPAMWVVSARTTFALSISPVLALLLPSCFSSLSLYRTVLSFICLPSLSRSLLLLARRAAQWQGLKILANSPRCLSQQKETRLTSIRAPTIWLRAQEEEKEVDSDGKRGVLSWRQKGKKRKRGAELECWWRGRKGSMLHVGWVMEGCSIEQWQLKRKKCSVWGVGVKNDIYNVSTLPGRTWQVCKGSRRQSKFKVDGRG